MADFTAFVYLYLYNVQVLVPYGTNSVVVLVLYSSTGTGTWTKLSMTYLPVRVPGTGAVLGTHVQVLVQVRFRENR